MHSEDLGDLVADGYVDADVYFEELRNEEAKSQKEQRVRAMLFGEKLPWTDPNNELL